MSILLRSAGSIAYFFFDLAAFKGFPQRASSYMRDEVGSGLLITYIYNPIITSLSLYRWYSIDSFLTDAV